MATDLSKFIAIGALLLSFNAQVYSKQSSYMIPNEISNNCSNVELYETAIVVKKNNKCSLEIVQKSRQLIKLLSLCFPDQGIVPKETCGYVMSRLKVTVPLYNKVMVTVGHPDEVLELDFLLRKEVKHEYNFNAK
jgi:hypothetical protein